jgi:acetolactate synthase-1/2/3 large subunit
LFYPLTQWGIDEDLAIIRVDTNPDEPECLAPPALTLLGDAKTILQHLISGMPAAERPSRRAEMETRQANVRIKLAKLAPQAEFLEVIRAELPEGGIFVDEVTQVGFAARLLFPVYKPRTFLSPGYQDNLGWGYATALGAQHARPDVPVLSISGDGGFLFTSNELATAMRHGIPLTAVVFNDGAFGNVRRIQEEQYGNRLIASDLSNPDFVHYAQSFGVRAERARDARELAAALNRSFKTLEPSVIEVPVGPMPSPWEFIFMPRVRGS